MPRRPYADQTKLRYVLYARKSTEEDSRQVRSVPDQIKDCQKLARDLGLNVVEVLEEKKSAKRPRQRPIFNQMLKDIETGKYDAILCWHPDRLSRNMLEGGTIIDMLDDDRLKDIRFRSHEFSNDSNGKMLLGMLFVFSKQYSDDLSDKVSRGHEGNFNEGKSSGAPKWGYNRSEVTGFYEPNEYFEAIQEAWRMRATGESYKAIILYLRSKNVHRTTKDIRAPRRISPGIISMHNMFGDPFYYGVLIQAGQSVDLRELPLNFTPVTDKATYDAVQMIGHGHTRHTVETKRGTFFPLHGFVYCAVCGGGQYMRVGQNKNGSGQHVLSYRCDNAGCTRKPKTLRAKHVFNSIYDMLDGIELTDEAYEHYSAKLDSMTDEKIVNIKQQAHSKRSVLAHLAHQVDQQAESLSHIPKESPAHRPALTRLERLATQRADIQVEVEKLEAKVAEPAKIKLSKDEFLNVIKTAADKMKAASAVEKDTLCRILFLNLRVDNDGVSDYVWKEPFAGLVKSIEFSYGRGDRI